MPLRGPSTTATRPAWRACHIQAGVGVPPYQNRLQGFIVSGVLGSLGRVALGGMMLWEVLGDLSFHQKILAILASLVTITGGITAIVWRIKTWNRRRLKLLEEFLEEREGNVSSRKFDLLRKVADSEYSVPTPGEPDVSKEVEVAIQLLDRDDVQAAQRRLETLQERIVEKRDFIQRYSDDLNRHHANVSLFLAAIADRRNDAETGLRQITKAKSLLGSDLDVLKYEGLLQLRDKNWIDAKNTFTKLENQATGTEARHYKAEGADGRGDALRGLQQVEDAIEAYGLALDRMAQAEPIHRHPLFQGTVLLKVAKLQKGKGDEASLRMARNNVESALTAFKSSNRIAAGDHVKTAEALRKEIDAQLAPRTNTPTN